MSNTSGTHSGFSMYEQMIQACPSAMLLVDYQQPNMPIVFVNRAFEELTGYRFDDLVGKSCCFLLHNDLIVDLKDVIRAALERKETFVTEQMSTHIDGTMFWVELRISPVIDQSGTITHAVGIKTDITERKNAQLSLERRAQTLTALQAGASEIISKLDVPTILRNIIDRAKKLLTATQGVGIYLYETEHDLLRLEDASGVNEERIGTTLRTDQGLSGYVFRTGQATIVHNYNTWSERTTALTYDPPKTLIGVPLRLRSEILGVLLVVADSTQRKFDQEDLELAEMLAAQASAALQNAQLFDAVQHELTERGLMEKALRESNQRYDELVRNIPLMVYRLRVTPDHRSHFDYLSPRCEEFTGFTVEEGLRDASLIHSNFTPEDLQIHWDLTFKSMETLEPFEWEGPMTIHGQPRWIQLKSRPTRLENGDVIWDGIHIDITERKQIEDALRESEKRHRMTLQGTRAGTWEWNVQTGETIFNERWAEIVGYSLEELSPINIETWETLTHPDDLETSSRLLEEHFSGKSDFYECEIRMKHKNGHWVWILDRGMVLEWTDDGKPLRMFGTHVDITSRKNIEDRVKESEKRLRTIFDNIPVMIAFFDQNGGIEFTNTYWNTCLGWPDEELSNLSDPLSLLFPDPGDRQNMISHLMEEEPGWHDFETQTRHHGAILTSWANVPLSDGRIIGIGQDITERRKLQERDFENKLEKERMAIITTFLRNAAHEFRTPLATIGASAFLMARMEDPDRRAAKSESIQDQIRRIARLLDMLLTMVKLESDIIHQNTPVDLGMIIKDVQRRLHDQYGDRPVLLTDDLSHLPRARGSADFLFEAFSELMDNAYRFTPKSGLIRIKTSRKDNNIVVEIHDNGPGISPEALPHIFETFWREDNMHSTPGFGLGLRIAEKSIEQHGGQLTVKTEVGRGTCFCVSLPIFDPPT